MRKIVISILFLIGIIHADTISQKYTFVFSNVKNIENANHFISTYLKSDQEKVSILKHKGRYRVTYGTFKSRSDAYKFKKKLPEYLKNLKPFLIKTENKLLSINKEEIKSKQSFKTNSKKIKKIDHKKNKKNIQTLKIRKN